MKKGLGDVVESITKATGIDKLVHKVVGEDCGCDERKAKLNQMFPFYKPMNEERLKLMEDVIIPAWKRKVMTPQEKRTMYDLYEVTFSKRVRPTSCSSCLRNYAQKLIDVYENSCNTD